MPWGTGVVLAQTNRYLEIGLSLNVPDGAGGLWIGSYEGLSHLEAGTGEVRLWPKKDQNSG